MPIYEYQCQQCQGYFQKLVRGFSDPVDLACPRCHTTSVQRRVSQVAQVRSDAQRAEALGDDRMLAGVDENDPRAVAKWAKQLGQTMGEEAGGDWNEMVDQMIDEEFDGDAPSGTKSRTGDDLGWG
jgi:putative FmdB family regulatory protein